MMINQGKGKEVVKKYAIAIVFAPDHFLGKFRLGRTVCILDIKAMTSQFTDHTS